MWNGNSQTHSRTSLRETSQSKTTLIVDANRRNHVESTYSDNSIDRVLGNLSSQIFNLTTIKYANSTSELLPDRGNAKYRYF